MQRLIIFLCFSIMVMAADAPFVPQVPRKAEGFGVQTGQDKYIFLNQYAGKTIILAFLLTDCDHCQFTTGVLNRIQQDYADRGVVVLASAIEIMSALHIPDFVARYHPNFPVGYDPQDYATTFLGYPDNYPMSLPQVLFIDPGGTIQVQFAGDDKRIYKEVEEKTLRETLERLLAQQKTGRTALPPSAPKQ
jgi:thiol-disulfide isomerase/thioredoxin